MLLKGVTETVQNEVKEQEVEFLGMLLGVLCYTLGASLLGNRLTGRGVNKAGEGVVRAGYGNKMDF